MYLMKETKKAPRFDQTMSNRGNRDDANRKTVMSLNGLNCGTVK